MKKLTAQPWLLKKANFTLIRKLIRSKGSVTKAEITSLTNISSTTVRTLINEMVQCNEVESIGYDESSGGRKAERYIFKQNRYYCAAFCITDNQIHSLLINVCGEIVQVNKLDVIDDSFEASIIKNLDELKLLYEIKAIGIGVPGTVDGGSFWRKSKDDDMLYKIDIGDSLAQKYNIPIVLENDVNATAIGFARCYEKRFPSEMPENNNMAYLHFEKSCLSAGLISQGKIVRGHHNFAGEIGLVAAQENKRLSDCFSDCVTDMEFISLTAQSISWICGILNPQYVTLGGPALRRHCIGPITDLLFATLPKQMLAEILFSSNMWHDYYEGMACITSVKMFDEIQFTTAI